MQGSRLMGQGIMATCSSKNCCSKSPPSFGLAEQLPRLVTSIVSSVKETFTPARSCRSPLHALSCLPQAPHGFPRSCFCLGCPRREGEKGAGKERRQIRCLLSPTLPLASSATLGLCSALTERQKLAAHPAVQALSLLTVYSNKQA